MALITLMLKVTALERVEPLVLFREPAFQFRTLLLRMSLSIVTLPPILKVPLLTILPPAFRLVVFNKLRIALLSTVILENAVAPLVETVWVALMVTSSMSVGTIPPTQVVVAFQDPDWAVSMGAAKAGSEINRATKHRKMFLMRSNFIVILYRI